jgi:spore maturation protein CgeB
MPKGFKFLFIDTYYPSYLISLYSGDSSLPAKSYHDQRAYIMKQCFGTADFYSANLIKLGSEAEDIIANDEPLQRQWALENGFQVEETFAVKAMKRVPIVGKHLRTRHWLLTILEEQIKKANADVLYLQDLSFCPPEFLARMKQYARLIVGQIACPLPPSKHLFAYDLILTSFPHYVDTFRSMGIRSEYLKIGFEPAICDMIGPQNRQYSCTFVGGISPAHGAATALLEEAARRVPIDFFGYGADTLSPESPIIRTHHGPVWGLDMYRVLCRSRVTLNRHINVAGEYANNMRLYEATGCGAMLVTDNKRNLGDLFSIGKEIVAYENVDDLCDRIRYYEKHDVERKAIAEAGQKRTLNDHTYYHRMEDLIDIIEAYAK